MWTQIQPLIQNAIYANLAMSPTTSSPEIFLTEIYHVHEGVYELFIYSFIIMN
jgi:hypothetical protein